MILGNLVRFSLLGWWSIGPAKWDIRIGYRSGVSLLRVTFGSTMPGSASGLGLVRVNHDRVGFSSVRVKFEFGSLTGFMLGSV